MKCRVAFAGNPNVGKTTLINAIAGANLKVGNWPGVTVEKKEADLVTKDMTLKLIDLPGTYSLSPYSIEEKIAREYLLEEKPDIVIDVVDSTNLQRNLYLTVQLMELEIPIVMALNIWDDFKEKGYRFDIEKFYELTGVRAIPTIATKGVGKEELLMMIQELCKTKEKPKMPKYSTVTEEFITRAMELIPSDFPYPKRWTAIKILEGEKDIIDKFPEPNRCMDLHEEFEKVFNDDAEGVIAEERYTYIASLIKQTLKSTEKRKKDLTDILDSIFLNRFLGIPIFIFMMYIVFKFTFDGSGPFIDWTDGFINGFIGKWTSAMLSGAPEWLQSLVIDGIIGGVGLVLTFVPLMFFLYFFLALLEESGYMARAAFVMDRAMRSIGLHGKSFIPLIIGFGCNVPSIYATRALENERDRKLTALLVPFMSCGARLPIYALFTAVFFKENQAGIVLLMYLIGIAVAIVVGLILKKTVFKGEVPPFVMELPPYRFPTGKMLWKSIASRTGAFVKKAGTVIAATMVLLWVVINIPYGAKPQDTILGKAAVAIAPVFKPAGFDDWRPVAALIPGTIAKEAVIGALGQVYDVQEEAEGEDKATTFNEDIKEQITGFFIAVKDSIRAMFTSIVPGVFEIETEKTPLQKKIKESFTPLSAFSYMVFCLLWIPCIVTLGAIYQEFGWKMVGGAIALTTITPYIVSTLIYQIGLLLGF
ncbi:ferrous iron transport protein B [Nitratiruptor sp. YY09-18]|uniref:ferrous iron transport protein B n=1 Tax=Nitratiruptor sp. YY09-18 TaxID=2724901 RepID=UPI001915F033|nr:ferrous iron transport protein B [Nitratiruptor sp. YY09-18]BCD68700.1 ferrous iron transport protein B [Nitratiruptor sp. YY09-18]